MVIGATLSNFQGKAYVYKPNRTCFISGSCPPIAILTTDSYSRFGASVATSGNIVVVGYPFESSSGSNLYQGSAYIFLCNDSACSQIQKLNESDEISGSFGSSIGISGNTIVVGAPYVTMGDLRWQGAVYVYQCLNYTCSRTQNFTDFDAIQFNQFGSSVAISGNLLGITSNSNGGSVSVYNCQDGNCTKIGKMPANNRYQNVIASFIPSVAISGNLLVVSYLGSVNVYDCTETNCNLSATLSAKNPFGSVTAVWNNLVLVGSFNTNNSPLLVLQSSVFLFNCSTFPCTLLSHISDSRGNLDGFASNAIAISSEFFVVGQSVLFSAAMFKSGKANFISGEY